MLSSSWAVAQGGPRVPWPSPPHRWPRGWTCSPPPFTTSSQKTNVNFCQLPESSIPTRKSSAPFGEVPFQALVQLPAQGGQSPAVTAAPDPAWSCRAPASLGVCAAPVGLEFAFPISQLLVFHPAPLWVEVGSREG